MRYVVPIVLAGCTRTSLYRAEPSPDRRFRIEVYAEERPAMPGQGGDARGYVRLVDVETNETLEQTIVEMVQHARVEWHGDRVIVARDIEWPLPP